MNESPDNKLLREIVDLMNRHDALKAENARLRESERKHYEACAEEMCANSELRAQLATLRAAAERVQDYLRWLPVKVPADAGQEWRDRLDLELGAALADTPVNPYAELVAAAKAVRDYLVGFVSRSDWEEPKAAKVRLTIEAALKNLGEL